MGFSKGGGGQILAGKAKEEAGPLCQGQRLWWCWLSWEPLSKADESNEKCLCRTSMGPPALSVKVKAGEGGHML